MSDTTLEKAQKCVDDFLGIDARNCKKDEFGRLYQKAAVAQKEVSRVTVNSRIEVDQKIRIVAMLKSDPLAREQLFKRIVPRLLPPEE